MAISRMGKYQMSRQFNSYKRLGLGICCLTVLLFAQTSCLGKSINEILKEDPVLPESQIDIKPVSEVITELCKRGGIKVVVDPDLNSLSMSGTLPKARASEILDAIIQRGNLTVKPTGKGVFRVSVSPAPAVSGPTATYIPGFELWDWKDVKDKSTPIVPVRAFTAGSIKKISKDLHLSKDPLVEKLQYDNSNLSSVLAELCVQSDTNFLISPDLARLRISARFYRLHVSEILGCILAASNVERKPLYTAGFTFMKGKSCPFPRNAPPPLPMPKAGQNGTPSAVVQVYQIGPDYWLPGI